MSSFITGREDACQQAGERAGGAGRAGLFSEPTQSLPIGSLSVRQAGRLASSAISAGFCLCSLSR